MYMYLDLDQARILEAVLISLDSNLDQEWDQISHDWFVDWLTKPVTTLF